MAIEAIFIDKKSGDHALSFEALVKEGISLSQSLSGHSWTDYNIHDPGVTLLEQLCYVLSDIAYRCDYPVIDYLLANDERFTFESLSLHLPDDILSAHPTTRKDLIALLRTQLLQIDSISIVDAKTEVLSPTLHDIYVSFDSLYLNDNSELDQAHLVEEIKQCYAGHRSLNENLQTVHIKQAICVSVHADISLNSASNIAQTLAHIYFCLVERIVSLQNTDLLSNNTTISIDESDLYAALIGLNTVAGVQLLRLLDENDQPVKSLSFNPITHSILLNMPKGQEELGVNLYSGNKRLPIYYGQFASEYAHLASVYKKQKEAKYKKTDTPFIPISIDRELASYSSITQHFPPNYKLGHHQMALNSSKQARAHNLQYKAYLSIYDQVLNSQTQSLHYIRTLFSPLRSSLDSSGDIKLENMQQQVSAMNQTQVADLAQFVDSDFEQQVQTLAFEHSEFQKRATRVLDYFLALYGERMNQHALSMFSQVSTQQQLTAIQLSNKIRMLQHIKALTKDRLKGVNLLEADKSVTGLSGLQLKVAILLGFSHLSIRQLHKLEAEQNGFHVIEHGLLGQTTSYEEAQNKGVSAEFYQHQISFVFPDWSTLNTQQEFRELVCETVMMCCPAHILAHVIFVNKTQMRKLDSLLSPWRKSFIESQPKGPSRKALSIDIAHLLFNLLANEQEVNYGPG